MLEKEQKKKQKKKQEKEKKMSKKERRPSLVFLAAVFLFVLARIL